MRHTQTHRRALLAATLILGALTLSACEKPEPRTVKSVKTEYAQRFVDGLAFGNAGRIKAESFDPKTFVLNDVMVDDGPDRLYHADLAEMHVSPEDDTIVLEFIGVTGADPEHGLTENPVATTQPIKLPFDVVP